jgi:UDPglucose 6-dehydrogenase
VHAFDPSQPCEARRLLPAAHLATSPQSAVEGADVLVVATDWEEFASYDLGALADRMADPVLVDLRNMFEAKTAIACGFRSYVGLGRGARQAARAEAEQEPTPAARLGAAAFRSVAAE